MDFFCPQSTLKKIHGVCVSSKNIFIGSHLTLIYVLDIYPSWIKKNPKKSKLKISRNSEKPWDSVTQRVWNCPEKFYIDFLPKFFYWLPHMYIDSQKTCGTKTQCKIVQGDTLPGGSWLLEWDSWKEPKKRHFAIFNLLTSGVPQKKRSSKDEW